MRQISFLIVIVILLISMSGFVSSESVCGNELVCGVFPDSQYGYGLVEFCGTCYPCGVSDGVCPEDFAQEGIVGSCKNCPDPDCLVNISGRVYSAEGGAGVPEKEVFTYYSSSPTSGINVANSTSGGQYNAQVPSGKITLLVKDLDWDSEILNLNLVRGTNYENIDIKIKESHCNSDCTDSSGVCRADCANQNGCEYYPLSASSFSLTSSQVADSCNYNSLGTQKDLGEDEDNYYRYDCCNDDSVDIVKKQPVTPTEIGAFTNANIDTLRSTAIPVRLNGRIVHIVFNIWQK